MAAARRVIAGMQSQVEQCEFHLPQRLQAALEVLRREHLVEQRARQRLAGVEGDVDDGVTQRAETTHRVPAAVLGLDVGDAHALAAGPQASLDHDRPCVRHQRGARDGDLDRGLAEIARVLSPGGRLVAEGPPETVAEARSLAAPVEPWPRTTSSAARPPSRTASDSVR
mgnify:CR=1 FL=1